LTKQLLVLVKQVPTTESVRLNEETGTMIRSGSDIAINPLDLHAVEAAVRIKETNPDPTLISVLSMGPPQAESAIREALAFGCDRGILLSGREFAGADTWATAYTLVQWIQTQDAFDLILCGERATDGETGQVGPMVAAMLSLPLLTYVSQFSIADGQVSAVRAIEGGAEHVSFDLPAVACVVRELNVPRLPTLSGKVRAHDAQVLVLNGEAIGAEPEHLGLGGSPTRVVRVEYPSFRRNAVLYSAESEDQEALVARLSQFIANAAAGGAA